MTVRHSQSSDLATIRAIYAYARAEMKKNGNPTQWGDHRPPDDRVVRDIAEGIGYVLEDGEGQIAGVFAYFEGDDPTYGVIDGAWCNDRPYGVVHRVAAAPGAHGVVAAAVSFALSHGITDLRMDTHRDNAPMRHLLRKLGFRECGVIQTDDGTPRLAYHLVR